MRCISAPGGSTSREARCEACDAMSDLLDSQPDAALDAWRVEARLLKAEIEHHRGLPQDALATLEAAIERFDGSTDPGVVLRVARARLASVLNLRELAQHAQAQVMCLAVADQIEAGLADAAPELRIEGVRALTLFFDGFGIDEHANRAELVGWLLDRYGRDESSQVRRMAVRRAYDWSVGLREQDDGEVALAACERLLATFGADTDAGVQRTVASALLNKGFVLLERLNRPEEALAVYEQLAKQLKDTPTPELQDTLSKANAGRQACLKRLRKADTELPPELRDEVRDKVKQGRKHGDAGESREAIALFDEVLAAYSASPHPELRRQCAQALDPQGLLPGRAGPLCRSDSRSRRDGRALRRRPVDGDAGDGRAVPAVQEHRARPPRPARRRDAGARRDRRALGQLRAAGPARARGRRAVSQGRHAAPDRPAQGGRGLLRRSRRAHHRREEGTLQLWAAKSMINKAKALDKLGDPVGQAKAYRALIARFGDTGDAALRERVANAPRMAGRGRGPARSRGGAARGARSRAGSFRHGVVGRAAHAAAALSCRR